MCHMRRRIHVSYEEEDASTYYTHDMTHAASHDAGAWRGGLGIKVSGL
jgi:hypothetical protein